LWSFDNYKTSHYDVEILFLPRIALESPIFADMIYFGLIISELHVEPEYIESNFYHDNFVFVHKYDHVKI